MTQPLRISAAQLIDYRLALLSGQELDTDQCAGLLDEVDHLNRVIQRLAIATQDQIAQNEQMTAVMYSMALRLSEIDPNYDHNATFNGGTP